MKGKSRPVSTSIRGSKLTASSSKGTQRSTAPKALRVLVDGNDVTPLSLLDETLAVDPKTRRDSEINMFASTTLNTSSLKPSTLNSSSLNASSIGTSELKHAEPRKDNTDSHNMQFLVSKNQVMAPSVEDLAENITITLSETMTETLFMIRGVCVGTEYLEHPAVSARNETYQTLCESKDGSDLYMARVSQTRNESLKNSEVLTSAMPVEDTGCQVSSWDIFDSLNEPTTRSGELAQKTTPNVGAHQPRACASENSSSFVTLSFAVLKQQQVEALMKSNLNGCLLPLDIDPAVDELSCDLQNDVDRKLSQSLLVLEKGIQQNVYHKQHLLYRAIPMADNIMNDLESQFKTLQNETAIEGDEPVEILEEKPIEESAVEELPVSPLVVESPDMQLLFEFKCEVVKNRTISGMAWNRVNQDLLAVSYCEFDFSDQKDGFILFWTLKNPEFPERIIKCPSGVCSIDFSLTRPSLIAAGMYDGTIAIYDLQREGPESLQPILKSSKETSQHKDPVWQVKWVNKDERGEMLVTLSTDGRVTEWSLKKGFTSTDLMVLKRVSVPSALGGTGEGIISRTASGLALDFPADDSSIYFTGTEDGIIHKCSCSYNEQYLGTYFAHSGPIYKLKCSPFWYDSFITCSADWSVKLWDSNSEVPLLHFQSVDLADEVHDIAWSNSLSTVFGMVAGDGRIEIWDLNQNALDPIITQYIERKPEDHKKKKYFSSLAFAYNASIVTAGTTDGVVNVYRLRGVDNRCESFQESVDLLKSIVELNQKN